MELGENVRRQTTVDDDDIRDTNGIEVPTNISQAKTRRFRTMGEGLRIDVRRMKWSSRCETNSDHLSI